MGGRLASESVAGMGRNTQTTAEQTISLKVIAEIEHRILTALDTYQAPTLSVHIPFISTAVSSSKCNG